MYFRGDCRDFDALFIGEIGSRGETIGLKENLEKELDQPIIIGKKGGFFSKDLRVIIIYEDGSGQEFFMKWPRRSILTIKDMSYFILPRAVIRMKKPTLMFFYNNPMPIQLRYEASKLTALDLYSDEGEKLLDVEIKTILGNVTIDSEIVNNGFDNTFMRGLYNQGQTPLRTYIYIIGAIIIGIMVLLQATGKVDIIGNISAAIGGAGK